MQAEPTYATERTPERHTDGPAVAGAIERWLGRRPTRWQQMVLDVGLERIDGPGSPWAYDEVVLIVGRRCGKTVTTFGVPLARALAGPVHLPNGRTLPFKATHTAQNLTAARQRFDEDLVQPYSRRFTELELKRVLTFNRAAADTHLTLDPRKGRARKDVDDAVRRQRASELRVLAPTPSTARGAGVLHLTFDEALTYSKIRGEQLMAAARPTMAEMRGQAQAWMVSNISTDTDDKTYLWHMRQQGRAAVKAKRRDGICYLEFSLPPGENPEDEDAWWRHYPALGDGIVGIRELRRDREKFAAEFGVEAFTAEYLCRWPDENEVGLTGWRTISLGDWTAAATLDPQPADAKVALGVDIDPFGRSSTIVSAVADPDRPAGVLVEVLDHRPGSSWVKEAVLELADDAVAVGIDDYGAGRDLATDLRDLPVVASRLITTTSADIVAACYSVDAGLREQLFRYRKSDYHEPLTQAAAAAERTSGRGWQWERRVSVSQTPLVAATLAVWALGRAPEEQEFFVY